jgi:hypothetical protein
MKEKYNLAVKLARKRRRTFGACLLQAFMPGFGGCCD